LFAGGIQVAIYAAAAARAGARPHSLAMRCWRAGRRPPAPAIDVAAALRYIAKAKVSRTTGRLSRPTADQYSQDSGTIMYINVYFRRPPVLSIWLLFQFNKE
jgi:hypothetical protein